MNFVKDEIKHFLIAICFYSTETFLGQIIQNDFE